MSDQRRTFALPLHWLALAGLGVLAAAGCNRQAAEVYSPSFRDEPPAAAHTYIFSVHPLHNPQRLQEVFGPLMDHLSTAIPDAGFTLEAARDYAAYDARLAAGRPHFSLPNPYQTLAALEQGYRVFAKVADDEDFRGIILVRKDSGITRVQDLIGKSISYPAPTALAATMMPQLLLKEQGLDVRTDVETRYVGSQESAVMNVFYGRTAAGATWPPPWRALLRERPELSEALDVRWRTDPLPSIGVVVRADVPDALVTQVQRALTQLNTHAAGRAILEGIGWSGFEPADATTYAPVRAFIERFHAEIGAPPQ